MGQVPLNFQKLLGKVPLCSLKIYQYFHMRVPLECFLSHCCTSMEDFLYFSMKWECLDTLLVPKWNIPVIGQIKVQL